MESFFVLVGTHHDCVAKICNTWPVKELTRINQINCKVAHGPPGHPFTISSSLIVLICSLVFQNAFHVVSQDNLILSTKLIMCAVDRAPARCSGGSWVRFLPETQNFPFYFFSRSISLAVNCLTFFVFCG